MPTDFSIDNRDIRRALNILCDKVIAINRFIENTPNISNDCIILLDTEILKAEPIIRLLNYFIYTKSIIPLDHIRTTINEAINFPSITDLIDSFEDLCLENLSSNATSTSTNEAIIPYGSVFVDSSE